jgi:Protein of unknown function (DUF2927)
MTDYLLQRTRRDHGPSKRMTMRCALALLLGALALAGAGFPPARGENAEIGANRAAERKTFTDAEIAQGFFKTVFGAELRLRGRTDVIRKYDGPIRVFVESRAKPDRRDAVAAVVADIRARVDHLDIAMTEDRGAANVLVVLVRDKDLARTVRTMYGRDKAKRIARLNPQCLSGFSKDATYRILRSNVLLVVDAGDYVFYDCAYEELLQALGPINDTDVPWTMFNDDVQKGFFDVYDQYILNILYDPRIRPGMTKDEVRALLPQVMPTVRAWIAKVNDLKP